VSFLTDSSRYPFDTVALPVNIPSVAADKAATRSREREHGRRVHSLDSTWRPELCPERENAPAGRVGGRWLFDNSVVRRCDETSEQYVPLREAGGGHSSGNPGAMAGQELSRAVLATTS
jgi:hypothetical protein